MRDAVSKPQEIKLGYTFEYFIPGVLLIIIGGVSALGSIVAAIFLLIPGISLLLLQTGIEIDLDKKRVRKYYELFSLRFGSWIMTKKFSILELSPTNESQTMQHRAGQTTVETKTFDVIFVSKSGFSRELNEFKNYNTAYQVFKLIADTFVLESRNGVEEIRKAIVLRRKSKNLRK